MARSPSTQSSISTYDLARELAARVAAEAPELRDANLDAIMRRFAPCHAGAGFGSVRWQGKLYSFGPVQSRVVAALWRAWEEGLPEVKSGELLNAADSDSEKLSDLFREHPAWGEMIVPGQARGTYRLAG